MVSMATSGERLRAIREAKGLSIRELEERTGIDRAYISRVENGLQRPSLDFLGRVSKALGLSELTSAVATVERFR
jgi:transcriptional regulator with XRE-family HTH domain